MTQAYVPIIYYSVSFTGDCAIFCQPTYRSAALTQCTMTALPMGQAQFLIKFE